MILAASARFDTVDAALRFACWRAAGAHATQVHGPGQLRHEMRSPAAPFAGMGEKMKKMFAIAALSVLGGCVSAPQVDFSNSDPACAQQCSANHTQCMSGFKLFPLANESACKTAMETCAKTCPAKGEVSSAAQSKKAPSTTSERLKELDGLFKDGLISKEEYETKRLEVIKAM